MVLCCGDEGDCNGDGTGVCRGAKEHKVPGGGFPLALDSRLGEGNLGTQKSTLVGGP